MPSIKIITFRGVVGCTGGGNDVGIEVGRVVVDGTDWEVEIVEEGDPALSKIVGNGWVLSGSRDEV